MSAVRARKPRYPSPKCLAAVGPFRWWEGRDNALQTEDDVRVLHPSKDPELNHLRSHHKVTLSPRPGAPAPAMLTRPHPWDGKDRPPLLRKGRRSAWQTPGHPAAGVTQDSARQRVLRGGRKSGSRAVPYLVRSRPVCNDMQSFSLLCRARFGCQSATMQRSKGSQCLRQTFDAFRVQHTSCSGLFPQGWSFRSLCRTSVSVALCRSPVPTQGGQCLAHQGRVARTKTRCGIPSLYIVKVPGGPGPERPTTAPVTQTQPVHLCYQIS